MIEECSIPQAADEVCPFSPAVVAFPGQSLQDGEFSAPLYVFSGQTSQTFSLKYDPTGQTNIKRQSQLLASILTVQRSNKVSCDFHTIFIFEGILGTVVKLTTESL